MPEALVLDDRALLDDAELVVGRVGDRGPAITDLDAAVGLLKYIDVLANEAAVVRAISK